MRRGLTDRTRTPAKDPEALTVSALTRRIKTMLESGLGRVVVEGEIGSLTRAASGHLYITLKDAVATLDVVMWRGQAARLNFTPREGDAVILRGEITVYEPRGRYQLVASSMAPAGAGELQRRFEMMVEKLRAEGLFAPEHKIPLPAWPATVGLATSPTGAAVRDMLKILRRRMPGLRIVVAPCRVQGDGAAEEIAAAVEALDRWGECDVIIVGRGGGSLEDLWAFNEERVARAIFACATPIVSAVGHEVDVTVADLAADVRAATPSEAAETVVPDAAELARRLAGIANALTRGLSGTLRDARTRLDAALKSPALRKPMTMVETRRQRLDETVLALHRSGGDIVDTRRNRLALASARLDGVSPLATLGRGYSVTQREGADEVLRRAEDAKPGERIVSRLASGRIVSEVRETFAADASDRAGS